MVSPTLLDIIRYSDNPDDHNKCATLDEFDLNDLNIVP
jgi:hypothetical protein